MRVNSTTLSICLVAGLAINLALLAAGHGAAGIVGQAVAATLGLVWSCRTIEAMAREQKAPPTTISAEWSHSER